MCCGVTPALLVGAALVGQQEQSTEPPGCAQQPQAVPGQGKSPSPACIPEIPAPVLSRKDLHIGSGQHFQQLDFQGIMLFMKLFGTAVPKSLVAVCLLLSPPLFLAIYSPWLFVCLEKKKKNPLAVLLVGRFKVRLRSVLNEDKCQVSFLYTQKKKKANLLE